MKLTVILTLAVATGLTVNTQAQTPRDLDDLVDARASSGERELEDRGYDHRKTIDGKNSKLNYWWGYRERQCVVVTVKDGHFSSILKQPEVMCDESDSGNDYGSHHGSRANVNDVVGMRASSGERELQDMGYEFVNSSKGSDRIWSNWWSDRDRQCITVVTMDGRYDSVVDTLPGDCDRDTHGSSHHGGGGEGVTLYKDNNFGGRSLTLYRDESDLGGTLIGNDELSSIRVPRGCEVVLFQDTNFRGRSLELDYDERDLGQTRIGNDQVSSIEVDCR